MNITIKKTKIIPDFPSGSGITYLNGTLFAIGDDSPYLFSLDEHFKIQHKTQIYEVNPEDFKGNRIKKKLKIDLETLEAISNNELISFGSGSKLPNRAVLVRIFLHDRVECQTYSLLDFYKQLMTIDLLKNTELNIEATAFFNDFLYLFNRNNNVIIRFSYPQFLSYLNGGKFPDIEVVKVELPTITTMEASFSGATFIENNQLLFTASAEASENAYNDGEVLGSLAGILDLSDFNNPKITEFTVLPYQKKPLKVESITIKPVKDTKKIKCFLITDDDNGNTEIIKALIRLN